MAGRLTHLVRPFQGRRYISTVTRGYAARPRAIMFDHVAVSVRWILLLKGLVEHNKASRLFHSLVGQSTANGSHGTGSLRITPNNHRLATLYRRTHPEDSFEEEARVVIIYSG